MSDQPKGQQLRSRVRAALIAYFVLFNVLGALPSAGSPSPERLERPRERAELSRWSRLFDAVGLELEPERLKELYLVFAARVEQARAGLVSPIAWWMELTQSHQSWRLFAMPHDHPSALEIIVSRKGEDELLYRSGDDEHGWGTGVLEYRRVRAAYKPSQLGPPGTYDGFAQRISERIFDEQPDVERVSVSLVRRHVTLPGKTPDAERERTSVITFTRAGRE
ncbi:MAG: hypothetical protein ABW217_15815 [Polyangiaceae bacterium]